MTDRRSGRAGRPRRRRGEPYHHGDLRAALIREGLRLVEEGGVGALKLRDVAAPIGVTHAAIKHHFPHKHSLHVGIATAAFGQMEETVRGSARADADPRPAFISVCLSYIRFGLAHPKLYRAMYALEIAEKLDEVGSGQAADEEMLRELNTAKAAVFDCFVERVKDGQRQGVFRDGRASDLARLATALCHGLVGDFIDERLAKRTGPEAHAKALLELMMSGLERRA